MTSDALQHKVRVILARAGVPKPHDNACVLRVLEAAWDLNALFREQDPQARNQMHVSCWYVANALMPEEAAYDSE